MQYVSSHRIHEIAVEALPHGVAVVDDTGTILYVNHRLSAMFGYQPEEVLGTTMDGLIPGVVPPSYGEEPHPDSSMEHRNGRRKDGSEVPIEIRWTSAPDDIPGIVVASVVDLSERRHLDREAADAAERRLGFERLVTDLSTRFVHAHAEQVDAILRSSLREIGEALSIDRCTLWQFTEDQEDMVTTHGWTRLATLPQAPASARALFPWFVSKIRSNELIRCDTTADVPSLPDRENMERTGTRSVAVVPMSVEDRVVGALSFGASLTERTWDESILERLKLVAAMFAQVLARRHSQLQLERALAEVGRLRDQLASENVHLRDEVKSLHGPRALVSESPAIREVLTQIQSVSATDATVLLLGETGSGKEVVAQAVHDQSERRDRAMVRVNCGAIPTALLESELFGRERGAYTGALSRQIGRFEAASGTTIFLDEVGDLPLEAQVKLLRILQDHTLERLGSIRPIKVDVRVIAATNRNLQKAVADREFREDLFYRLNVFPITVPPLRERLQDIPVLAWTFVDEFAKAFGKRIDSISRDSLAALQRYPWPGNVRELRNVIERAMIVSRGPTLIIEPPSSAPGGRKDAISLADVEADHIRSVLKSVGWRIRGRGGAAELLGMKPTTLESRMAKLGIRRPRP